MSYIRFPFACNIFDIMGKLRTSGRSRKSKIFEATTVQTRRGPKTINVAVHNPQTPQSHSGSVSPSKKRAFSPAMPDDIHDDDLPSIQPPKRSRQTGKVGSACLTSCNILIYCCRRKTSFLMNILTVEPNYSSRYSDMRHHLQIVAAQSATTLQGLIDAKIVLCLTFFVICAASHST